MGISARLNRLDELTGMDRVRRARGGRPHLWWLQLLNSVFALTCLCVGLGVAELQGYSLVSLIPLGFLTLYSAFISGFMYSVHLSRTGRAASLRVLGDLSNPQTEKVGPRPLIFFGATVLAGTVCVLVALALVR